MSKFILTIEVELELVSELVRYLKSAGVKIIDERFVRDGEKPLAPGVPSSSREDVHPRGRSIIRKERCRPCVFQGIRRTGSDLWDMVKT